MRVTEGALLDVLAAVGSSRLESLDAATEHLRRDGVAGVLVAVLGALSADDAERLARLRHGSAACVAVLVDTETWSPGPARVPEAAAASYQAAAALLTDSGWRVLRVAHGTTLPSVWPLAGARTGQSGVSA